MRVAAQVLLIALLLIAPWPLGGVYSQTQVYLYAGLMGCLGLWYLSYLLDPIPNPERTRLPLLILPLVLGIVAGTLQLIPLPDSAAHVLGPESEFASGEDDPGGIVRVAATVYPLATRMQLAKLSFALIAFFLGTQLFESRRSQVWLFGSLAVLGLIYSFFGIAQKLSWNGRIFWSGPEVIDGKPFASFVNRNNAAGYLNLTLAAAIGFLIWAGYRESRKGRSEYDMMHNGLARGFSEKLHQWLSGIGQLTSVQLFSGICVVFIAAGVAASASRGGIIAMAIAAVVVTVSMARRGLTRLAGVFAILLVTMSLGLVTWLGISGSVGERFAELSTSSIANDGRVKNWSDTLAAMPEIWGMGSGLGTYRYFHRPYQKHQSEGLYVHAENQYVEALVEGGIWGLLLVVFALVAGMLLVFRLRRSQVLSRADGVAFVGMFALLSQSAHAFLDYGLLQPANMLTFAVLMGAVGGRAVRKLANGSGNWYFALPRLQPAIVFSMFALILLLNGISGWMEIFRAAKAEDAVLMADRLDETTAKEDDYQSTLDRLLNVAAVRPDDAHLQLSIAEVYVKYYGFRVRNMVQTQTPEIEFSEQQLDRLGSLTTLYRRANQFVLAGAATQLQTLRDDELIRSTLIPARSALLTARSACGLLPQVEMYLALLSFLESDAADGLPHLERAVYLSPYESRQLHYAGSLAISSGRVPFAISVWKRAYALHHRYRYDILTRLSKVMTAEEFVDQILPDDIALSKEILLDRGYQVAQPEIVRTVADRLAERYGGENPAASPAEKSFLEGYRLQLNGRLAEARKSYQSAFDARPDEPVYRAYLIEVLIQTGDLKKAEELISHPYGLQNLPNELKRLQNMLASASDARENDAITD